jgi:predicted lipase
MYDNLYDIHNIPDGFELIQSLSYNDNKNYIGFILKQQNNQIWIVFRGTMDISDVLQDVKTTQSLFLNKYLVFTGILQIYNQFRDILLKTITTLSISTSKKIIITGHSLGAGLSVLTTFDLSNNYNTITYTYGCPRVGNPEFVSQLTQQLKDKKSAFYRIQNSSDIITYFPLPITIRLLHPTQPFFYDHVGHLIEFTDNRFSYENNHSIITYIENIPNIVYTPRSTAYHNHQNSI